MIQEIFDKLTTGKEDKIMSKTSRITAIITRGAISQLTHALNDAGVQHLQVGAGRAPTLEEPKGLRAILTAGNASLSNDPVDIVSFLVEHSREDHFLSLVAKVCRLDKPGRGSVFSEAVNMDDSHKLCGLNKIPAPAEKLSKPENLYSELVGIGCIVQRGQGDAIARVVLESGATVPVITYGDGTGVRDKLGLLRITIPAEKEVLNMVVSRYDAEVVMELMISAGKLDQPGRGFIYTHPVSQGIINNRITRGSSGQAASMEQIIAAMDGLKGGIEWRRREGGEGDGSKRQFLSDMVSLTLVCNEGQATDLVKAAMEVGAPGATISKLKYVVHEQDNQHVSPAREAAVLIISAKQKDDVLDAIRKAGGFKNTSQGEITSSPVPRAFTYLAPAS